MKLISHAIFSFLFLFCCSIQMVIAQDDMKTGIASFNRGDYKNAYEILKKDKNNPVSLYYAGLSLEKLGNKKAALISFGQSVYKCSQIVSGQILKNYDRLKSETTRNEILDIYEAQIEAAILSAKNYDKLNPTKPTKFWVQYWKNQLVIIRLLSKNVGDEHKLFSSGEISSDVRILHGPIPGYTNKARKNNVEGKILVRIGFLRNGQIGFVYPLGSLPHGLTDRAVAAARGIQFKPATKNGHAVSVVRTIQYQFSIK